MFDVGPETPTTFKLPKWTIEIFDQDRKALAIDCCLALEGFADWTISDRHVGNEDSRSLSTLGASSHNETLAQWNKFRIALDIGHEVEHFDGAVLDPSRRSE